MTSRDVNDASESDVHYGQMAKAQKLHSHVFVPTALRNFTIRDTMAEI